MTGKELLKMFEDGKKITIRFTESIEEAEGMFSKNMMADIVNVYRDDELDVNKYNNKVQELVEKAKEKGFIFEFSHNGDEYDDCYSLYVPVKGFDMDKVKEFLTLWEAYNDEMNELIKQ